MSSLENAAKAGLLVDFDALFDTRLAVLNEIDPMLALHALNNGYENRADDSFEFCSFDLFRQLYLVRDNKTLELSMMTHVKDIVLDFARDSIKTLKSAKTNIIPNIYINVYPYKISKDASGEILKPFHKALEGKAHIHMVNIPPNELTVDVCKKHLSYVIKYDYMDWLHELGKAGVIQHKPLNEITLVAPRLYLSGKPSEEQLLETRNQMEPYQCTEIFFASYIKLELYPVEMFCAKLQRGFVEELTRKLKEAKEKKD